MAVSSNTFLFPLSALYSAVIRTRFVLYRLGILKTKRVGVPVISVGNITTGGTGKTPFVSWLARRLAETGHKVCILTRGYGRADSTRQVVVSDGQRVLASADEGGDEPRLLAETLVGIAAVISNADRVAAAKWAIDNLKSSVLILDDGFQHLAIARDLNIVTVDSTNPWGGRRLLPQGPLREPLSGLSRADAIVLTRTERVTDIETLRLEASRLSKGRPVILSETRTTRVVPLTSDVASDMNQLVEDVSEQPVLAFCAIGNPQSFFAHVAGDGYKVVYTESFRDHYVYTQHDVDELTRNAKTHGAHAMITTAKDAVKLRSVQFAIPCFVIEIEMKFDTEEKLLALVSGAIGKDHAAQFKN